MRLKHYQNSATTATSASESVKQRRRRLWITGGCRRMATPSYTTVGLLWKELGVSSSSLCTSPMIWPGPVTLKLWWNVLISDSTFCGGSGSLVSPQNPDQLLQIHHRQYHVWLSGLSELVTGNKLSVLQDISHTQCLRNAHKSITKDCNHPMHGLFTRLPTGTRQYETQN